MERPRSHDGGASGRPRPGALLPLVGWLLLRLLDLIAGRRAEPRGPRPPASGTRALQDARPQPEKTQERGGGPGARFSALYGGSPIHLLAHLILLPLALWALLGMLDLQPLTNVVLWLLGAIVLHDFVLLPFYSALDRTARVATARPRVSAVNYLRVPAAISALLLVVYWGVISGRGEGAYTRVSGLEYEGYLGRWLLVSAALFAVSTVLYLLRLRSGGGSKA